MPALLGRDAPGPPGSFADPPLSLSLHLRELRSRVLKALAGWGACAAAAYAAFPGLLYLLLRPPVVRLVYQSPTEPFFAQIRLSCIAGLLVAFPWLLYQAWAFVAPALRPPERRGLLRLIPAAYALFLLGGGLGLFAVAPAGLRFLLSYSTPTLEPYITISAYLGYLGSIALGMAVLFQLPVALYALALAGLARPEPLAHYRRHIFLGLLIASAALTPGPDVYSQLLLAVPAYLLFELSLLAMRLAGWRSRGAPPAML